MVKSIDILKGENKMSACGSCPLYDNTCEGNYRGSEICQERLFDYIDELTNKYTVAKKPHVKRGAGTRVTVCPSCESFISYGTGYCSVCGQKLDWH